MAHQLQNNVGVLYDKLNVNARDLKLRMAQKYSNDLLDIIFYSDICSKTTVNT